ncbi:hypothetical protein OZX74_08030 [Bifidobacterium sp. ESL0798]|uniref:hypothetical protein n=1 Tax=Bifidobacterium sp. ESL0798 TaxID=2983235 RepID=UPI0023F7B7C0|nr:hypothetical protein [Bifidobacterium sp. ESL0798]WEV73828.1 hypothetical protein OZX74_08030 [Bifidobacterium sp. ESL0798]
MSTNPVHYSSGSVNSAHPGFAPARTGSSRPARPAQLDPALTEKMAGGMDPEEINEMSHASAQAMLDRVHHTQDPQIVQRVLTLVDREGVDIIAELWSRSEPDSLPGILWRLYLLRTWMRRNQRSLASLYRIAEPEDTAASAIAGVDTPPSAEDIVHTADSILSGAFTGDFSVALQRASAFIDVIAKGLAIRAKMLTGRARKMEAEQTARREAHMRELQREVETAEAAEAAQQVADEASDHTDTQNANDNDNRDTAYGDTDRNGPAANRYNSALHDADDRYREGKGPASSAGPASNDPRTVAARLLHTGSNLMTTSADFRHGASLWRQGKLE